MYIGIKNTWIDQYIGINSTKIEKQNNYFLMNVQNVKYKNRKLSKLVISVSMFSSTNIAII